MKYAIINLPYITNIIRRWRCTVTQMQYLFPPIELCYISSVLKNASEDVFLLDSIAEKISLNDTIKRLKEISPDYLIFMPGMETLDKDLETAMILKDVLGCSLICFGHFPSLFPEEIINKGNIDYLIIGEPEETISELNQALKTGQGLNSIKGLAYKDESNVILNEKREPIKDIDLILYPDRTDLKHMYYYLPFPNSGNFTVIYSARSCPFRCTYCIRSWGDSYRQRSVDNVLGEIDECVKNNNIKTLWIGDDTFTINREWTLEFCNKLSSRPYKVNWICLSRPDTIDEEKISAMKRAGCVRILIGFESGSDRILKLYNRMYDTKALKSLICFIKKQGIEVFGFFLIGGPYEEVSDVYESMKLAETLDLDYIALNVMRMYYGTKIFDELMEQGDVEFGLFPYKSIIKHRIDEKKLTKLLFEFYRRFYFRPGYIFKNFFKIIGNLPSFVSMAREYLRWEINKKNMFYD